MPFKICVIGCGGISNNCHGPSYVKYALENPGVELAACCDLDAGKAEAYAKRFGFRRPYTDFTEMLRAEQPGAVCVTVDENHTGAVGAAVLKMGYASFIEKPPGKTSAETRVLISAAREGGAVNQVGYNRRFLPVLTALRGMLDDGAARHGDIQFIRYDFYRVDRRDEDFSDTAVHGIDAVRYVAGADYADVSFRYQALPRFGPGVQNIYMDCVMTNGVYAQLSFCPVTGVVVERATVHAEGGTWIANTPIWAYGYDRPGELLYIKDGETAARISGAELCDGDEVYITNGFYNEDKSFFDDVRAGRKCACDLESSLNTSLVKDCITNKAERFVLNG